MTSTPYTTQCDRCGMGTWYEGEQQCHRTYPKGKRCDLGHWHEQKNGKHERCTGTLRVIDRSQLDPRLAHFHEIKERVEITYTDGTRTRCYIGKSTGWKPVYLEILRANSSGGPAIPCALIKSVRGLGRDKYGRRV